MKNSILNGVVGQLNDNMQLFFHCGELRKNSYSFKLRTQTSMPHKTPPIKY